MAMEESPSSGRVPSAKEGLESGTRQGDIAQAGQEGLEKAEFKRHVDL